MIDAGVAVSADDVHDTGVGARADENRPQADRVSLITVTEHNAGQRLDNFLLRLAKGVPKSHVYRIVRSGEVRVNRARAGVDQRLAIGDRVRVPPLRIADVHGAYAGRPQPVPAIPPVLYEDAQVLAVDKPAGVAAHGGSGIAFGLIERVRAARPQQPFLELAHRLDRETSGVLLLAKTRAALVALHAALRDGQIDKRYLALVHGDWVNDRQHVRLALTKYVGGDGQRRVDVDAAGAPSHTVFTLVRRFGSYSLLVAQLKTGRTHQIRVHLSHLGFPIVGDDKYGDFALNRALARGQAADLPGVRFGRMFLHAASVAFSHPISGVPLELQAPLPEACGNFLEALERA